MNIIFNPQRRDDELLLSVSGDIITINGIDYDLSVIPEGATLPVEATDCVFLSGEISRVNGDLSVVVTLPHKADPHQSIAFPLPVNMASGVVVDTANNVYPWSLA